MRVLFTVFMIALCCVSGFAQETDFERNKTKYKMERFVQGEDATSGFDYLVYRNKNEIAKIRVIWSSSAERTYRVEDYFFRDGKLLTFANYNFARKFYNAAAKGGKIPLKEVERAGFSDSKLTTWQQNGKSVSSDDKRWKEKESEVLESSKDVLETVQSLKEESRSSAQ